MTLRLKMIFGLFFQREGLYKSLYIVHVLILAGFRYIGYSSDWPQTQNPLPQPPECWNRMAYYYFQKSVGDIISNYEFAGESTQPIVKTLRPVWGLMDKCYPVTTQRRKLKSGKKQVSRVVASRDMGGRSDAASNEDTDILSQEEGQEKKKLKQEVAVYLSI